MHGKKNDDLRETTPIDRGPQQTLITDHFRIDRAYSLTSMSRSVRLNGHLDLGKAYYKIYFATQQVSFGIGELGPYHWKEVRGGHLAPPKEGDDQWAPDNKYKVLIVRFYNNKTRRNISPQKKLSRLRWSSTAENQYIMGVKVHNELYRNTTNRYHRVHLAKPPHPSTIKIHHKGRQVECLRLLSTSGYRWIPGPLLQSTDDKKNKGIGS
jgi:hypothetical protein